jgi:hypothetical protein
MPIAASDIPFLYDPVLLGNRKRIEQESVNRAEDRAVGANTKRQSDDRNGGESRSFEKIACGITNITEERSHDASLCYDT